MREDIESWDIHTERAWPYFRLSGKPEKTVPADVQVRVSVKFLNEASALEFETQVRALLTPLTQVSSHYHGKTECRKIHQCIDPLRCRHGKIAGNCIIGTPA